MLKLDKNDPLDRLTLQILQAANDDEPMISIEEWENAMDELADESDCAQILQERGLCAEDVLREAKRYRTAFRVRMSKRGLPLNNRFALCTVLYAQATQVKKQPSLALLRIYCEILTAPDWLLDPLPDLEDEDNREQVILQYLRFCEERDELLQILTQRKELAEKFEKATKKIRNPLPADCNIRYSRKIIRCFARLFKLSEKENGDILLKNVSNYIQITASIPSLRSIEPLFMFRLLTKHKSRMCSVPDLNVNISALWKRDNQSVDRDNGRNFKQYGLNLSFFRDLCHIYEKHSSIDFALCWYGLDQITVLGDFYRKHVSTGWVCINDENDFPWIPTVEELVEDVVFSCFPNGYEDNVLLEESDLTYEDFSKFLKSPASGIKTAMKKISDYMNRHAEDIIRQASNIDTAGRKILCQNILKEAKIKYQPKSPYEIELFLAAINDVVMNYQDLFSNHLLVQIGHVFLNEPVGILEWSE